MKTNLLDDHGTVTFEGEDLYKGIVRGIFLKDGNVTLIIEDESDNTLATCDLNEFRVG
jgi:hypothetical protein